MVAGRIARMVPLKGLEVPKRSNVLEKTAKIGIVGGHPAGDLPGPEKGFAGPDQILRAWVVDTRFDFADPRDDGTTWTAARD